MTTRTTGAKAPKTGPKKHTPSGGARAIGFGTSPGRKAIGASAKSGEMRVPGFPRATTPSTMSRLGGNSAAASRDIRPARATRTAKRTVKLGGKPSSLGAIPGR